MITRFTLDEIDRAIFNKLRLALVSAGLLPDSTLYAGDIDGYNTAKASLPNVIEIFGVGSSLGRNEKLVSHLTINRVDMTIGSIGGGPATQFVEYLDILGNTKFRKVKVGVSTRNLSYEIRFFTDRTSIERALSNLILNELGLSAYINSYIDLSTQSEKCFFIQSDGDINLSTPEFIEWQYRFTVQDVWLDNEVVIRDDIAPMTSVLSNILVVSLANFSDAVEVPEDAVPFLGLKVWLNPVVGFTPADWLDSSNSGNNFVQGAPSNQPTYDSAGINGKPAIMFAGTDVMGLVNGALLTDTFTLHIVLQKKGAAAGYDNPIILSTMGFTTPGLEFVQVNGIGGTYNVNTSVPALDFVGLALADGTAKLLTIIKTPISMEYKLNGVTTQLKTGIQNVSNPAQFIGAWGGNFFNGCIGDVLLYDTAQSVQDITQVVAYELGKYGI